MSAECKRVVVAGGGITGLSAAYRLQRAAQARGLPLHITLLEREAQAGGKLLTSRCDGLIVEGGPDSFLASKPQATQLCSELGLGDELIGTNDAQRRTYVYSRGRLHDLPEGLSGLVPSRLSPMLRSTLISAPGKARLLMDFALPARRTDDDESVAQFVSRRLGRETFARLIEPLMGGIYAGDAKQLSLMATFPQLRQLERQHGSLLRGVMQRPAGATARARTGFLSLRGGMAGLSEALARALNADLHCGCAVETVRQDGSAFSILADGQVWQADGLILCTPAYATAEVVRELDAGLAEAHRAIPYVSTATLSLAYRRGQPGTALHGFGFVVPAVEGRRLLACTWASNKFAGRAPEDVLLLRCFIGRAGQADLLCNDDEQLLQIARDELKTIAHITAEPLTTKVYRWAQGMPQYNLGHLERVRRIEARLREHPGLFVAGAAYHGVGLPDCIRSADEAAQQCLTYLFPK